MALDLRNCDCMELMAQYPDKHFDLGIVDPPYGFGVNMNMGRRKGKAKKHEDKDWDNQIPSDDYFDELMRVSKNQIIWGGNYFGLPANKCFIIWDKGETIYGRDFAEAEYAWHHSMNPRGYGKEAQTKMIGYTQHRSLWPYTDGC